MSDDRMHDLAGAYVLGALDPNEREAFERHLADCADCANDVRRLQPVVDGLGQAVPLVDPPPALRARVLSSIQATSPQPAERPKAEPVSPKFGERAKPKPAPSKPRGGGVSWLAAAAAAVIAVGLGLYVWQLRDRLAAVERRLDETTARAAASESQVAQLRQAAVEVRTTALVIGAPDLVQVDLAGQSGSPAKARAFWSRSHGLVFAAVDLPPLPPGKVYQLWVVGPQAPVSAAIFEPDAAGRATAVVEAERRFPEPAAFAVTLEPAGGVPQPTGDKVLVGLAGP